ncbi:LapA family protein [Nereida sp. MMG025]|uniref:LapA family protein n=1 Tax=Nereida sp. MMG025 TaxID=2909981 RepID=UPI001F3E5763|nr:LapA family protein [Nereida sp. MMG025]MCF6445626.1 LapA family protein [Nereida sp. MMG025]
MRYIRYIILAAIAVALIVVAMANRGVVTLRLMPAELAELTGVPLLLQSVDVPLFAVIFAGIGIGILLGFVWEWVREHKHRAEKAAKEREVKALEREVRRLKGKQSEGKDEVLALLDQAC